MSLYQPSGSTPNSTSITVDMPAIDSYIQQHFRNPQLDINHLLMVFNIKYARLYDLIKSTYGILPRHYIERYRIGQVLLQGYKHYPFLNCRDFGFLCERTFGRSFERATGLKPRQWFAYLMQCNDKESEARSMAQRVFRQAESSCSTA